MNGYYYLHTNGELIYKPNADPTDFRDSTFVRHFWPINPAIREMAWNLLIEASALGVKDRVAELSAKWHCDDKDAAVYAERVGCKLFRDGNQWCATRTDAVNLQESPAGFGVTGLEAMAMLCKEMGFKAQKLWGAGFVSLLARRSMGGA